MTKRTPEQIEQDILRIEEVTNDDINNGKDGTYWNNTASDHAKFAKELRDMMTQVIRTQKSENRMIQANTKTGI